MNIVYIRNYTFPSLGSDCPTAIVPGEEIEMFSESSSNFGSNGRVVKDVPSDRVLLLDTCWRGSLKIISDDCQFVMPTNGDEWQVVKPILKELAERRVFVLSESRYEYSDLRSLAIIEECRKSFYSPSDGGLINNTFERDNLSPEKMAEAGFMFAGGPEKDFTVCYFDKGHKICFWDQSDDPKARHLAHYDCLSMELAKNRICIQSVADGRIIPVQLYKVHVSPESHGHTCDEIVLITHSGAPIKIVPWSDIMSNDNVTAQAVIKSSLLAKRNTGKTADSECFELFKQSISLTHFSGLLRDYESVNHDFITELQCYKTKLHDSADLATADGLLEGLKSHSVVAEVNETVKQLATLNLVNEKAIQLRFLPSATHKTISFGMKLMATKELQEFANTYGQRYFVDDFLNGLVKNGTLGCLFTSDYFNTSKRCEKLISLLAKGTELTQLLIRISEVIRELLEPFVVEEPCDCRPGIKPDSL